MGASIGPVIGAAVIGDIYKLEERGRAVGVSFAVGKSDIPYPCPMSRPDFDSLNRPHRNNFRSFCWRYIFVFYYCFRNIGLHRRWLSRLYHSLLFMEDGA